MNPVTLLRGILPGMFIHINGITRNFLWGIPEFAIVFNLKDLYNFYISLSDSDILKIQ